MHDERIARPDPVRLTVHDGGQRQDVDDDAIRVEGVDPDPRGDRARAHPSFPQMCRSSLGSSCGRGPRSGTAPWGPLDVSRALGVREDLGLPGRHAHAHAKPPYRGGLVLPARRYGSAMEARQEPCYARPGDR